MKIHTIATLLLLGTTFTSCDAPRTDRRVSAGTSNDFALFNPNGNTSSGNTSSGTTTSGTTTGTTTSGNGTNSNVPSDATHCQWSNDGSTGYPYGHVHLGPNHNQSDKGVASDGAYSICQSSTSETDVYIQLKNPITDHQLCLIPTTHSGDNSTYIGEPRCLYVNNSTSIYKISMMKNRTGYSSYPLTGVMIMRDHAYSYGAPFYQVILAPDAYIFCSQWLAQYGDPSYCVPFKSAGHYVYAQFPSN